jgi:hypothetical protein
MIVLLQGGMPFHGGIDFLLSGAQARTTLAIRFMTALQNMLLSLEFKTACAIKYQENYNDTKRSVSS